MFSGIAFALLLAIGSLSAAIRARPQGPGPYPQQKWNILLNCNANQTHKVSRALRDMTSLATLALDGARISSMGFKHYFTNDELDVFESAMSAIASNNDPTNPPYKFAIDCRPTGDHLRLCGNKSVALVDQSPAKNIDDVKSMWLCPAWWSGGGQVHTERNLPQPNEACHLKAWCQQCSYKDYTTAGHTLLRFLTQFDAVAKLYNPIADSAGEHGSDHYHSIAGDNPPIEDARRLRWEIETGQRRMQPINNDESYAGAATELWVQKMCNKTFVPPREGY